MMRLRYSLVVDSHQGPRHITSLLQASNASNCVLHWVLIPAVYGGFRLPQLETCTNKPPTTIHSRDVWRLVNENLVIQRDIILRRTLESSNLANTMLNTILFICMETCFAPFCSVGKDCQISKRLLLPEGWPDRPEKEIIAAPKATSCTDER